MVEHESEGGTVRGGVRDVRNATPNRADSLSRRTRSVPRGVPPVVRPPVAAVSRPSSPLTPAGA